uniref:Uncharacterized protein n=1 Tax=Pavo cristatus TaxID=9049 RepID=A0A8C9L8V6_PAVCR
MLAQQFSILFCLETLSHHLDYLELCGDDSQAEEQISESLNGILQALTEDKSGIFLTLAKILKSNPRCAVKAAQVLSEIAKNGRLYFSIYNVTTSQILKAIDFTQHSKCLQGKTFL